MAAYTNGVKSWDILHNGVPFGDPANTGLHECNDALEVSGGVVKVVHGVDGVVAIAVFAALFFKLLFCFEQLAVHACSQLFNSCGYLAGWLGGLFLRLAHSY